MTGMRPPKISVVMPVYKGDEYLSEAVDSILNQTFTDFEFIIICDDPTEKTRQILDKYKQSDSRINVCYQEREGLVNSLNRGCSLARGEYIARMDADDISSSDRLEEQVKFMDQNPQVCVCGSWIEIIGYNAGGIWKYPVENNEIQCKHLFNCSIAHPSSIIRKEHLVQQNLLYDSAFRHCEDYDLWVQISTFYPLANIDKVLLKHRIHPYAVGQQHSSDQFECADRVRYQQLREFLGLTPTEDELRLHSSISSGEFEARGDYLNAVNQWLLTIRSANQERNYFDDSVLSAELAKRWYAACNKATNLGMITWEQFQASPLSKMNILTKRQRYTLLVKCLLKME
jgi:glycosyltransferase involved in cell wall biosynthesis